MQNMDIPWRRVREKGLPPDVAYGTLINSKLPAAEEGTPLFPGEFSNF